MAYSWMKFLTSVSDSGQTRLKDLWGGYAVDYGRGNSQISHLEEASNYLEVFNMSDTMAMKGGSVKLEHSDMCLTFHMVILAKAGFSHTAIEECKGLTS